MGALAEQALIRVGSSCPEDVANAAWYFVKLAARSKPLADVVPKLVTLAHTQLSPGNLASIA